MSAGLGFGAPSMLGDLSPELIARLLQSQQPQVEPQATGTIGAPPPVAMNEADTQRLERQMASPADLSALGAPPRGGPAPVGPASTPLPPSRPAEFGGDGMKPVDSFDPLTGQAVSGSPKAIAPTTSPKSGGFDLGDMLGRMNRNGLSDQLIAIGAGILSGKNFGEGLGQGLQNAQKAMALKATTDLAQAKAAREQAALGGNAAILKRAYPNLSEPELAAMASNSANVTQALQILRDPTHGLPKTPDQIQAEARAQAAGSMEGGAKPLDRIQSEAQAAAAGAAAGKPDDPKLVDVPQEDGTTVKTWVKPGEAAGTAVGAKSPQESTADIKNWQEAKRSGGYAGSLQDWIGEQARARAAQTTINMPPAEKAEQAKIGEARGNVVAEQIGAGRSAQDRIRTLDQMSGALGVAGSNITTGPLGEPVLRAKQALGGMLGKELPGTSATEMFNNMGPILAGEAARAITNRPAQIEFTTMLNAKPGLMNSIEGNRAMMDVMRQRAVADADLANIAARSGSADEFLKKKDEYEHANPMINPFTGQPFGSASAPTQGTASGPVVQLRTQAEFAAAPSGTRFIAPDGKLRVKP